MTPCGRSCHSLCICAVNSPVSRDGCSCLPSASQTFSIGERSGDLVGHGNVISLKTLLGESRNVDEHYPVDKYHLGDLIAWVAQSALKYRPRICELQSALMDH
ncbi:hypothetical protein TNCV_3626961 [Trichonephila clavipes]|nr:hypothetical protein TNCV_3626961 [Trichonephila clavipes]